MKKTWKLALAAFAVVAFTACGNDTTEATDTDVIESTDQVESDMDMDANMDSDTTVVQDTTVNDGVVDDIQEEQPPVQ